MGENLGIPSTLHDRLVHFVLALRCLRLGLLPLNGPHLFICLHSLCAEFLEKHNPFGQIPSLHDGDYHVFESRAIITYLASAYDKNHTLYPDDPKLRGLVENWIQV